MGGKIESNLVRIPPNPPFIRIHILESILDSLAERRRRKLTTIPVKLSTTIGSSLQYPIPQIPALYMNSMNI